MWRSHTVRRGRQILGCVRRQLSSEASNASAQPPTPQPPAKSGGFGLVKFIGLGLPLTAGGVVGYAWYDSDFRKQVEDNVPYAKELFENIIPSDASDQPKQRYETAKPDSGSLEKATMLNAQEQALPDKESSSVFSLSVLSSAMCSTEEYNDSHPDPVEEISMNCNNNNQTSEKDQQNVNDNKDEHDIIFEKVMEENKKVDENITPDGHNRKDEDSGNLNKSQNAHVEDYILELLSNDAGALKTKSSVAMEQQKIDRKESIEQQLKTKAEEEKADNAALEVVVNRLVDSGQYLTKEASKAQLEVAAATQNHTRLLKKAMDDTTDILNKDAQWEAVSIAYRERDDTLSRANSLVKEARNTMEILKSALDEAKNKKSTKKNPAIYPANRRLTEMTKELTLASSKVREADSEAKVMLKYKDLVDRGRKQFQMELESLVPDVKLGSKSRKLTEDELNALIAHAHRRIEQLQKQIAEQLSNERKRLEASLETQNQENRKLTQAAVTEERSRMEKEFEMEKQKLELDFLVFQEEEVRKQLARQAGAHSDHIKDILVVQQEELSKDFERQLNLKLLEEREKFQTEVAGWMSRLRGIETAVDARAASEKLARSAQDLWLACIALNTAITFTEDESSAFSPLKEKVEAVKISSDKNLFVENITNAIPATALERGVLTEKVLRDRFSKVASVSKRLGLITEPNASLYQYIVSFLHSFLKVDSVHAFSEKDIVNVDELDNCKLVAIARYWMERDNLEMALKFMNQLTGESRKAASDWIKEATLLLETKQVAHALSAYASATGIAASF